MAADVYPENDTQFEEEVIRSVEGRQITRVSGWSFFLPEDCPVTAIPGMVARFYGRGIGHPVRGLYLDGVRVFYETEEEHKESSKRSMYGESATEWLRRWDADETVWSVEMGGLGPGYEQCIQITAAEVLRVLLAGEFDASEWEDPERWKVARETIEGAVLMNETVTKLGLSGAQFGAALSLATHLFREGPIAMLTNPQIKDRTIQVCRTFPG